VQVTAINSEVEGYGWITYHSAMTGTGTTDDYMHKNKKTKNKFKMKNEGDKKK